MPAKIEEIIAIAQRYNIILIEDAAEALGAEYKGKKCGTFGDFGIISFNENKILTTFGGGALICKSEEDKIRAIYLASQAKENIIIINIQKLVIITEWINYLLQLVSLNLKKIEKYILSRRRVSFILYRIVS